MNFLMYMPCIIENINESFGEKYCLHLYMMKAVCFSETFQHLTSYMYNVYMLPFYILKETHLVYFNCINFTRPYTPYDKNDDY